MFKNINLSTLALPLLLNASCSALADKPNSPPIQEENPSVFYERRDYDGLGLEALSFMRNEDEIRKTIIECERGWIALTLQEINIDNSPAGRIMNCEQKVALNNKLGEAKDSCSRVQNISATGLDIEETRRKAAIRVDNVVKYEEAIAKDCSKN